MNLIIRYTTILILQCFTGTYLSAQDDNRLLLDKCARLEGGFIMGGQIFNDNLIYNPGGSFQYSYSLKSGSRSAYGLGVGVQFFEEEAFIPFYFDFLGLLSKSQNTPFLTLQTGYSAAWSNKYKNIPEYYFKGGLYFSAGFGRKFNFNDVFSSYISVSYKHQYASLTYSASAVDDYNEELNYDMIVISIGIMLEQ